MRFYGTSLRTGWKAPITAGALVMSLSLDAAPARSAPQSSVPSPTVPRSKAFAAKPSTSGDKVPLVKGSNRPGAPSRRALTSDNADSGRDARSPDSADVNGEDFA